MTDSVPAYDVCNACPLQALWESATSFLGCRYGILGGAMSWVSNHTLVAAISQAGGFGVLAGGSLTPQQLAQEITATRQKTKEPFGVNLITFHPALPALMQMCIDHQVSHVFLGGGMPSDAMINTLRQAGIKVIGFAPSPAVAKRLMRQGVQALVIEGHEAGGHVGPVSTAVLAQEILPVCPTEVPVFMAGGIADGRAIASYMLMGAAGCQLGTRFVCASESCAHDNFKQAFIRAHARDAVVSVQLDPALPVIPVRALANQGTQEFMRRQQDTIAAYHRQELTKQEAHLQLELFWAGALKRAVIEGDIQRGSLMAGQSVGMVTCIEPCADIVHNLVQQTHQHIHALQRRLDVQ